MLSSLLFATLLQGAPQVDRPFPLMLGDAAPPIRVAEWVQGQPVTGFEPGRVYVVEFWATWCPPCKKAIPHLNELSKEYAGKVRFVGVSVWEHISKESPYSVPQFVKGMGAQMSYTVAADLVQPSEEDGPMAASWLGAAGQNTIPTAFIVDQAGRIAWIGNPLNGIEKPLADVVAGKWDLAGVAKKYAFDMRLAGVSDALRKEIIRAKKEKDFAGAIRTIEAGVANEPALESTFGIEKYFLLLEAQRAGDAAVYGQRLVSQVLADNAMALNRLAWTIVDPASKWKQGDYKLAVQAAERASKLQDDADASTLDTLGLALFKSGQVGRAIEIQEKAVALAQSESKELQNELRGRLDEFKNAKKDL